MKSQVKDCTWGFQVLHQHNVSPLHSPNWVMQERRAAKRMLERFEPLRCFSAYYVKINKKTTCKRISLLNKSNFTPEGLILSGIINKGANSSFMKLEHSKCSLLLWKKRRRSSLDYNINYLKSQGHFWLIGAQLVKFSSCDFFFLNRAFDVLPGCSWSIRYTYRIVMMLSLLSESKGQ